MPTSFNILLIATLSLYIITPLYTSIRGKIQRNYVDQDQPIKFYSRKRILRLVLMNMAIVLMTLLLVMTVVNTLKAQTGSDTWHSSELQVLWLIFLACCVVCYGSGAYIASIVSEEYTLNKLEKMQEFKVLNLPVKLFHGPISHIMIFSGGLVILWLLALLEIALELKTESPLVTVQYFICGVAFGVMYAIAQIRNLTWKDQLAWMGFISLIFVVTTATSAIDIYGKPILMFNLGNSFSLMLILLLRLVHFKISHGKYTYDFKQILDPNL